MTSPPVRRRPTGASRPGAGQSPGRAARGWHPDDIVDGYLVPDERVVLEETRSVRGFLVGQTVWMVLGLLVAVLLVQTLGSAGATVATVGLAALGAVIGYRAPRPGSPATS